MIFLLCCRPYVTTERIFIWDKKIWNWLSTHASTICMILIKPLWWTSLWSISNVIDLLHRCPLPDSSELCLPAKISHLLCLIHHQFSPLNMCLCIILSYGHSQPDWYQLIFKWPCCRGRKSRPWSSVWVPWPLFCQFFLPDLNIIPLLGPHYDSSLPSFPQWTWSTDRLKFHQGSWLSVLASPVLFCYIIIRQWLKNHTSEPLSIFDKEIFYRFNPFSLKFSNFCSKEITLQPSHWTKYRFQEYINEFALISTLLISLTQMFWIFCLDS